jgi:hypothetical protein
LCSALFTPYRLPLTKRIDPMEIKSATPRATTMSPQPELTVNEQKIDNRWEELCTQNFDPHSADEAITTMVKKTLVN